MSDFPDIANLQNDLVTQKCWRLSCVLETKITVEYAYNLLNLLRRSWNDVQPSFEDILLTADQQIG
jgi:hypothetical protein